MKRFHQHPDINQSGLAKNPQVEAFLDEIKTVCMKHGMAIEHEDRHGSFEIVAAAEDYDFSWINAASVAHGVGRPS